MNYSGVPEGWEYVDSTYGPCSRVGLNKLASTLMITDKEHVYKVFNVGYVNAPASVLNFKLFRRKKDE
jgi:hypothetical protein